MMASPATPVSPAPGKVIAGILELATPQVNLEGVVVNLYFFVARLAAIHKALFDKPLVVTSGKDAIHSAGSLHSQGRAVDIRTTDIDPGEQQLLLSVLAYGAPLNQVAVFDERVLPGQPHLHLEYHGA